MKDDRIILELTRAEAVVLFEWLAGLDAAQALPFNDEAEQKVLWLLEGRLEKALQEPLAPNYKELLEQAKLSVLDSDDHSGS